MRLFRKAVALALVCCTYALADTGNSWSRVRYNGGTVQTKVDAKDWDNHLTVTSDRIVFQLKDGQKIEIATHSVTGLSYGQEAHRRVGTMVALGILVAPVALFGLFHKTRLHFIGIEYKTPDGKKAGLLLQGDKGNYRAILMALKSATGAPLAVAEKDREFVPTTVAAETVNSDEDASPQKGTVLISTTPPGADVYVDGAFVGNAPCKQVLSPGKHIIQVTSAGYKAWTRDLGVTGGSEANLSAVLEKAGASSDANAVAAPAPSTTAAPAQPSAGPPRTSAPATPKLSTTTTGVVRGETIGSTVPKPGDSDVAAAARKNKADKKAKEDAAQQEKDNPK